MTSSFPQFVKNDMTKENNNYAAVIIKALIESGFNDEIKAGKSTPYMAKPPILSAEEIYKKLTQSNLKKPNFDANESLKSTLSILKPFVSVGSEMFSLTLEFNAKEIPEILRICEHEISLK
jgi:hypothetical protein